jgi:hypothetical protein
MLVENHKFDEILVNFLIVGHTHTSIDQYFSILSRKIREATWIGSPLSLFWLLQHAHSVGHRPAVVREIPFIYDVTTALAPYINNDIKYYQKPHCFRFRRLPKSGICYMQYRDFSDMLLSGQDIPLSEEWRPKLPLIDSIVDHNSLEDEE